ncbi:MAG: hypothetical protein CFH10_00095 [Alphaproteobacteria bacterium MarineAlpha4_Bin2]|nr:MAG: hypothetical protein CFH10_00095 [Alphaproteobacteria bacterium MarineAlpha4_Bin2]
MSIDTLTTLALAEELANLEYDQFSGEDIEQIQRLILDYSAVSLCGSIQPWGRILTAWGQNNGAGSSMLIGSGYRVSASTAGLVNGTSAHGYELDDTHDKSMSHPGTVVISASFAIGNNIGATGKEVMTAIVAGYEAMTRIGMAANPVKVIEFGRHPTCLFGPFGAATAAGRLLGLDGRGIAKAWGIALSMASGANQFAFEPKGTMVKRMHGGIPAQNGITAAQLSHLGLEGPVKGIEGEMGFLHLFGKEPRPEQLRKGGNEAFEVHNISIKPYSCCRKFHSLIDALGEATGGFELDASAIDRITVYSPETAITSHQMKRPDSVMAAQYSMPYIVGATLAYGPTRFDAYGDDHHNDDRILELIDRVEARHESSFDALVPAKMPNRVDLHLRDGSTRSAEILDSRGTPIHPLSTDGVLEKARALCETVDPNIDLEGIVAVVEQFVDCDNVTELTDLLVVPSFEESMRHFKETNHIDAAPVG